MKRVGGSAGSLRVVDFCVARGWRGKSCEGKCLGRRGVTGRKGGAYGVRGRAELCKVDFQRNFIFCPSKVHM